MIGRKQTGFDGGAREPGRTCRSSRRACRRSPRRAGCTGTRGAASTWRRRAIATSARWKTSEPSWTKSSGVNGNSPPDCSSPMSGAPSPSKGFHHGTWPWTSSEAARSPSVYCGRVDARVRRRQRRRARGPDRAAGPSRRAKGLYRLGLRSTARVSATGQRPATAQPSTSFHAGYRRVVVRTLTRARSGTTWATPVPRDDEVELGRVEEQLGAEVDPEDEPEDDGEEAVELARVVQAVADQPARRPPGGATSRVAPSTVPGAQGPPRGRRGREELERDERSPRRSWRARRRRRRPARRCRRRRRARRRSPRRPRRPSTARATAPSTPSSTRPLPSLRPQRRVLGARAAPHDRRRALQRVRDPERAPEEARAPRRPPRGCCRRRSPGCSQRAGRRSPGTGRARC